MGVTLAVVLFLVVAVGWTLLPFLPGWREVRRRSDTRALPVDRASLVDVRHFAQGFRNFLDQGLAELLARSRHEWRVLAGEHADIGPYLIVPDADLPVVLDDVEREHCERLVMSAGDLRLPPDCVHAAEVYARGDVSGGARSVYRAVLADGALDLAPASASLRWLHAGTGLTVGEGCRLCGRVSTDGSLRVAAGCRFERLHAPVITFGVLQGPLIEETVSLDDAVKLEPEAIPHLVDTRGGRYVVNRDFELPAGRALTVDLVVHGDVILREGSWVRGSIKSRRRLQAEAGVRVDGSLVSERDMRLSPDCTVAGPIICEEKLWLSRGCVVGDSERPTTVSARDLEIEPGVRCHGTVWAHRRGDVLVPADDVQAGEASA